MWKILIGNITRSRRKIALFKLLSFLLTIALFLLPSYAACADSPVRKLRIGYMVQSGFHETDEHGHHSGYNYEYLCEISQYLNIKYEFIPGNWEDCKRRLLNGEIDLLNRMEKAENIEEKLILSTLPSGETPLSMFILSGNDKYGYADFKNFNGMKIGIVKNLTQPSVISQYAKSCGFSYRLREYKNKKMLITAITSGAVDAAVFSSFHTPPNMKIIAKLANVPFYFAVRRDNRQLIHEINKAMMYINDADNSYNLKLQRKYYKPQIMPSPQLTKAEKDYIAAKKILKTAYDKDYAPFEYYDSAAKTYKGASVELLELLCTRLGLELKPVASSSFLDSLKKLNSGEIDVLSCVNRTFERGDIKVKHWLSIPYTSFYDVIISRADDASDAKTIALPEGYHYSKDLHKNYSGAKFLYFPTITECLNLVLDGRADATFADVHQATELLSRPKYKSLRSFPLYSTEQSYAIGVSKTDSQMLLSIINKALNTVPCEEIDSAVFKHSKANTKYSILDIIYLKPITAIIIAMIAISVIISVFALLYINKLIYRKNGELKKADEAKSRFLSSMSHEIRTPLGAIIGLNAIISENSGERELVRQCSEKIDTSSKHLLSLVNDVLDMSQIAENKLNLSLKPFDLQKMVSELKTVYTLYSQHKNLTFSVSFDKRIAVNVCGDELRLKQIIINLLSNAIKYNVEGGNVSLLAELLSAEDTTQTVRFKVTDTGIGINKNFIGNIFKPFERENGVEQILGTGLGLSISSSLTKLMGSSLNVESTLGKGSSFWFDISLPLVQQDSPVMKSEMQTGKRTLLCGQKYIIAEDNDINMMITARILESEGAQVYRAFNGKEAYELFEKYPEGYFDGILMDIRMPVMNGHEAAKKIRAIKNRNDAAKIKIIALSANAFREDIAESIKSGINAHCSKPIDKEKLIKELLA